MGPLSIKREGESWSIHRRNLAWLRFFNLLGLSTAFQGNSLMFCTSSSPEQKALINLPWYFAMLPLPIFILPQKMYIPLTLGNSGIYLATSLQFELVQMTRTDWLLRSLLISFATPYTTVLVLTSTIFLSCLRVFWLLSIWESIQNTIFLIRWSASGLWARFNKSLLLMCFIK